MFKILLPVLSLFICSLTDPLSVIMGVESQGEPRGLSIKTFLNALFSNNCFYFTTKIFDDLST